MGFKVIVFLGIFIGMVFLISSQVGAARVLAHTYNTLDAAEKPKGKIIPKPFCSKNVYGSCIANPPKFRRRRCDYPNECGRGPPPRPT